MKVRAEITGLREIMRRLKVDTGEALGPAAMAGAEVIRAAAEKKAPRDTGFLAESIVAEQEGPEVLIGPQAPYGLYVEMGTSKTPAQPFLRPALDESGEAALEAMAEELRRRLEL